MTHAIRVEERERGNFSVLDMIMSVNMSCFFFLLASTTGIIDTLLTIFTWGGGGGGLSSVGRECDLWSEVMGSIPLQAANWLGRCDFNMTG